MPQLLFARILLVCSGESMPWYSYLMSLILSPVIAKTVKDDRFLPSLPQ